VKRGLVCAWTLLAICLPALSQGLGRGKASVTYMPPEIANVERGHPSTVELQFRVARGYHINSNQPKQEYLKKTELRLDPPTDIIVGKVTYPQGADRSFPFAPDEKLNVYTGDFAIDVVVRPLKSVLPQKYAFHGFLKYQACDNAACYPPKQLPVSFEVKVIKDRSQPVRPNPPQSPHAHS
jgi:Disulphide bond corrector protein DsbC